jgi:hypothetical protein
VKTDKRRTGGRSTGAAPDGKTDGQQDQARDEAFKADAYKLARLFLAILDSMPRQTTHRPPNSDNPSGQSQAIEGQSEETAVRLDGTG